MAIKRKKPVWKDYDGIGIPHPGLRTSVRLPSIVWCGQIVRNFRDGYVWAHDGAFWGACARNEEARRPAVHLGPFANEAEARAAVESALLA